jgi:hypothetical protein
MSRRPRPPIRAKDISGLKFLRAFFDILAPLADMPVHGNRKFFMDEYVALLLMHFFNPVLGSLRALQQATGLENVQKAVGVRRTSLGAMSESAAYVFDPELMVPILEEVMGALKPLQHDKRLADLPGMPIAVDGSFLRCLPKMVWAVFRTQSDKRGVRLHLQFDITLGAPVRADITEALGSEKAMLKKHAKPGMLYIMDRGFVDYRLYQALHDRGAFFVSRLKDNSTYEVVEDLQIADEARAAGVTCNQRVIMGSAFTAGQLTAPVRRLVIADPAATDKPPIALLTNTDLDSEVISLLYRYRWQVELFFRWFKSVLGCTHWLSQTRTGLTLQVYVAMLACLLIRLWTGRKPTRRTFEMIQLCSQGWAQPHELSRHIQSLKSAV